MVHTCRSLSTLADRGALTPEQEKHVRRQHAKLGQLQQMIARYEHETGTQPGLPQTSADLEFLKTQHLRPFQQPLQFKQSQQSRQAGQAARLGGTGWAGLVGQQRQATVPDWEVPIQPAKPSAPSALADRINRLRQKVSGDAPAQKKPAQKTLKPLQGLESLPRADHDRQVIARADAANRSLGDLSRLGRQVATKAARQHKDPGMASSE